MKGQRAEVPEKILFWLLLALVLLVLLYAPLHYGFIYPDGGEDTAHHISDLASLTEDFGYVGNMAYYGVAPLVLFTRMGLSALTVFSVFHYAVILAVFISLWILVRRFYGLIAAALSFYISVFIVMGTWYYFTDGTIFNIFNLFVVGVLAIFGLCMWLESGEYRWLIASGFLFIVTSLVHSTTYLYIMTSMLLFIAGFAVYQFRRKDGVMLKRILSFGAVFVLSILTAGATWMHRTLPALMQSMAVSIPQPQAERAYPGPFSLPFWITHYLNIGTACLLALALAILAAVLLKGKPEDKSSVLVKLNQPLSYILLSFMIVLAVGAFTPLGYNCGRFCRDLGTLVGLTTSILLGVGIANYRLRFKPHLMVLLAGILLMTNTPIYRWLGDYTAVRPCDIQAIDYLNAISAGQVEVQLSPTANPWIYELYTDDNINCERVYDLEDYGEADYILHRDNYMTYYPRHLPKNQIPMDSDALEHLESVVRVAEFHSVKNTTKVSIMSVAELPSEKNTIKISVLRLADSHSEKTTIKIYKVVK